MEDKLLRYNEEAIIELEKIMQDSQDEFKAYMDKKFDILMNRISGGIAQTMTPTESEFKKANLLFK